MVFKLAALLVAIVAVAVGGWIGYRATSPTHAQRSDTTPVCFDESHHAAPGANDGSVGMQCMTPGKRFLGAMWA
jgi:hypothetical protein